MGMLQQSRQNVARIRANKAQKSPRPLYTVLGPVAGPLAGAPKTGADSRGSDDFFVYEFCLSMGFNHMIELRLEFTCGPVITLGVAKHPPCWSQEFFLVLAS
jgi:hypothetical protein